MYRDIRDARQSSSREGGGGRGGRLARKRKRGREKVPQQERAMMVEIRRRKERQTRRAQDGNNSTKLPAFMVMAMMMTGMRCKCSSTRGDGRHKQCIGCSSGSRGCSLDAAHIHTKCDTGSRPIHRFSGKQQHFHRITVRYRSSPPTSIACVTVCPADQLVRRRSPRSKAPDCRSVRDAGTHTRGGITRSLGVSCFSSDQGACFAPSSHPLQSHSSHLDVSTCKSELLMLSASRYPAIVSLPLS